MPASTLAILADDLTGALDTAAPLVSAGLSVVVASAPAHVEAALAQKAEVVVAVTRSRHLSQGEAERVVTEAAALLSASGPQLFLKKVDSRLKGNVAVETRALARAAGIGEALVAPAVPDQGRFTKAGFVTGTGVSNPIAIAPIFEDAGLRLSIVDAASQSDIDEALATRLAAGDPPLLVGARGLGVALARILGNDESGVPARPDLTLSRTLLAFGSRDPITDAQVEALAAARPEVDVRRLAGGTPDGKGFGGLPLLLAASGEIESDAASVGRRFAEVVTAAIHNLSPDALIVGGGDTAASVIDALGIGLIRPLGEAAPGLPFARLERPCGRTLEIVLKSGGFGGPDVLVDILAG